VLDRPQRPPPKPPPSRRGNRWRRYRQRVRDGWMVPDMPNIGGEEISFS